MIEPYKTQFEKSCQNLEKELIELERLGKYYDSLTDGKWHRHCKDYTIPESSTKEPTILVTEP